MCFETSKDNEYGDEIIMNEYNERLLKNALEDIFEENDEEYLKEIEEANNDPRFARTPERDEAFYKFLDKELKKANRKKNFKRSALRVASIAAAILVGFSALTFSVHGFKEKVWEFLVDMTSNTHFSVMFSADENTKKLKKYEGKYVPSYIPDGYKVEKVAKYETDFAILLKKGDLYIALNEYTFGTNVDIDDEEIEYEEKCIVNGNDAVIVKKNEIVFMTIYYNDTIVDLNTNDTELDIIGFAELLEMN